MMDTLLQTKKLIVCVGSGGVGKTTTAAAMGLAAARMGRRVLVLTIDPARRLANALGLESFGNEIRQIEVDNLPPGGALFAVMLDAGKTFRAVVDRVSPDQETRDRVFENPVFRVIADNVGSSVEYMATERLYDVYFDGDYDLIVLDTPPVKNALDFLDAPGRLVRFLDRRIMKWFLTPYDEKRIFSRVVAGTTGVLFRLLAVIFGKEFLADLSSFLQSFRELYEGFRERHEEVTKLFSSKHTSFVIVAAPNKPSLEVAEFFRGELGRRRLAIGGAVFNQVLACDGGAASAETLLGELSRSRSTDLPPHTAASLLARLDAAHGRLAAASEREQRLLSQFFSGNARGAFRVEIPRLDEDITNLEGLSLLGSFLLRQAPAAS